MEPEAFHVGPVLHAGPAGAAIVTAIERANEGVSVVDRGPYVRVLVPHHCSVTRAEIEAELGRPFRLPLDLEPLMPAFRGVFECDGERVTWRFGR